MFGQLFSTIAGAHNPWAPDNRKNLVAKIMQSAYLLFFLVEKIKGFPLKVKLFRNTSTY